MAAFKVTALASLGVHPTTLALAPMRTLKFLAGATDPQIRKALAPVGWTTARSDEGYELVNELKSVGAKSAPADDRARLAMARCEEVQATALAAARAFLQMTLPAQAAFMFGDFVPGKEAAAVVNVMTFLERRHALENSPDRKSTRKADHEALAAMAEVGITKEAVKEMQGLVDAVKSAEVDDTLDGRSIAEQRTAVLQKIHAFVVGWSELARIVVPQRAQLIRLGIAKRRSKKGAAQPADPAPPAPVVATPAPVVTTPAAPAPVVVATPAAPAPVAVPAQPSAPIATPAAPTPAPSPAPSAPVLAHEESGPQSRAA